MAELPAAFLARMQKMLGNQFQPFLASYEQERAQGLRLNTQKLDVDQFLKTAPFGLEKIPWAEQGYYYGEEDRPGKHPYHEAGLYYIQEPSAMAPVELLDPRPGEKILDLCAAPGGKTTQIADKLKGEGFLLSNEFHPGRAKILSQNVERMGVSNCVVTNETPQRLSQWFGGYFDRILVDAPCSGEGMFRKNLIAAEEWSQENVELCAARQLDILESAADMLRPGGRLVYSTCTFSPEENEGTIGAFCARRPEFSLQTVPVHPLFSKGRQEWSGQENIDITDTIHLWPHKLRGEGHFAAVLRKEDGSESRITLHRPVLLEQSIVAPYGIFQQQTLCRPVEGDITMFGEELYLVPPEMADMRGMKVLRPGLHVGTAKRNRFEPSHALALYLRSKDVINQVNYSAEDQETTSYLKGEAIASNGEKGWCLFTVDGYSLGFGKRNNGMLKNHYPKGLRWN